MTNWLWVLTGMYLMAIGLTAKSAPGVPGIDQEQDEARARAAPRKRGGGTRRGGGTGGQRGDTGGPLPLPSGVYRLPQQHAG